MYYIPTFHFNQLETSFWPVTCTATKIISNPRFSPNIKMKEFEKGPKFEHPKFVLRINLLRKCVYSYINFTAQEYNLMTWTDQRQKCNFKVHILLFLAQISRINVVRKNCLFVQSYTRLMYIFFSKQRFA